MDAEESRSQLNAIEAYLSAHPNTLLVDPLVNVRKITSRWRVVENLHLALTRQQNLSEIGSFRQPAHCLVNSLNEFMGQMRSHALTFPVICKPVDACGTPQSHKMVRLFSLLFLLYAFFIPFSIACFSRFV